MYIKGHGPRHSTSWNFEHRGVWLFHGVGGGITPNENVSQIPHLRSRCVWNDVPSLPVPSFKSVFRSTSMMEALFPPGIRPFEELSKQRHLALELRRINLVWDFSCHVYLRFESTYDLTIAPKWSSEATTVFTWSFSKQEEASIRDSEIWYVVVSNQKYGLGAHDESLFLLRERSRRKFLRRV